MKRYLYIIIAVIVIIAIILIGWWFFAKGQPAGTTPAGTTGTLPQTGTQTGSTSGGAGTTSGTSAAPVATTTLGTGAPVQFGVLSSDPVMNYFVDAKNNVEQVEPDGKIAVITSGALTYLSSAEIDALINASFSFDGGKVLVSFGDPADPQTSIFDIATKAWTPLPVGIVSPVWSPSDDRIAYLQNNNGGTVSVVTLDVSKTTSKPVVITSLHAEDLVLEWPDKDQMVLHDKPSVYSGGSALIFDVTSKTLTPIALDETGLETLWSNTTSSAALLFSSGSGGAGGALSLLAPAAMTATPQNLTFLTLPSKCTFNYDVPPIASSTATVISASTTAASTATSSSPVLATPTPQPYLALYCAVPTDPSVFLAAHLPDQYDQLALFTSDTFDKVNTATGVLQNIFTPAQTMDASVLHVFNGNLFFVNRYDQKLYAISLAQQ